jgi:microcystin-dependent protein
MVPASMVGGIMLIDDITVEIRDKTLRRVGQITSQYLDLSARRVHLGIGSWTLRLPREHEMSAALDIPGSGIIVTTRGQVFSGPTTKPTRKASPEDPVGIATYVGVDDNVILWQSLALPDPAHSYETQLLGHDNRSGKAETVMKQYVNANIGPGALMSRRGLFAQKLTIASDIARGLDVVKSARFPQLGDLLAQIGLYSRLGFKVSQVDAGLVFDVYAINDRTKFVRFDIENGSLSEDSIERSAPSVTRVIVAGQGELDARQIVSRVSAVSTQAELDWGFVIERFKDQRQTAILAELQQSGDEDLLSDGFTSTAVKAVPSDQTMQYITDWDIGDDVTVVIEGQETTTNVNEVVLVANSNGAAYAAGIGDVSGFNPESAIAARVADNEQRVSALERNAEQASGFDGSAITTGVVAVSHVGRMVGEQMPWDSAVIPSGWFLEDGSAKNRVTYAALYAHLGGASSPFGQGDGSTTFNLPDKRGKTLVGYDASQAEFNAIGKTGGEKYHTLSISEMPNHNHAPTNIGQDVVSNMYPSTAGWSVNDAPGWINPNGGPTGYMGGGGPHNNLQPFVVTNFIIKY